MDKEAIRKKLEDIVDTNATDNNENPTNVSDLMGIKKIGEQLVAEDKVKFLTNISENQANSYAVLLAVNTKLNSSLLDSYIIENLTLRCGIKGKRAEDLLTLTKNMSLALAFLMGTTAQTEQLEGNKKQGFLNRLRG